METRSAPAINAQIFRMPEVVEIASVTTAGHYILASHLVRGLTKLDKYGKIEGDIASRWEHSADRKTWKVTLAKAQFSDGKAIGAAEVVASVERQRKLGTGVHFPFEEIVSVSALSPTEVEIKLGHARNDFIYDLSKPEFGVLPLAEAARGRNALTFATTSGPYRLDEKTNNFFHLRPNLYFPGSANQRELVLSGSDENSSAALETKRIQFFTTQQNLLLARHQAIEKLPEIRAQKPHVAFSYWLSLNPESAYFSSREHRATFQSIAHKFKSAQMAGHSWEKADQLYLPDGDGRPSAEQLRQTWSKIEAHASNFKKNGPRPKLRIVPLKITNSLLVEFLDYVKEFYEIEILPYETEDALVTILKAKKFDVKISSNDFSSIDLSENLKTTFNTSRPYIFVGPGSPIPALMRKAALLDDKKAQSEIFREIGVKLLEGGLIAPLAYQRIWFYYSTSIDIAAWSSIYPEISFWKVRLDD